MMEYNSTYFIDWKLKPQSHIHKSNLSNGIPYFRLELRFNVISVWAIYVLICTLSMSIVKWSLKTQRIQCKCFPVLCVNLTTLIIRNNRLVWSPSIYIKCFKCFYKYECKMKYLGANKTIKLFTPQTLYTHIDY